MAPQTYLPLAESLGKYAFPFLAGSAETEAGRHELYKTLEYLYHNTLFESLGLAALEPELAANAATASLRGIYNPATAIVDVYPEYTLNGLIGPEDDDTAEVHIHPTGKATADIIAPLLQVWDWSNLEAEKLLIPHYAANYGDVLLMAVVRPDTPARNGLPASPGKVWVEVRHPDILKDVRFDSRGNIVFARIEMMKRREISMQDYLAELEGKLPTEDEEYLYTAIYTKDSFATLKDGKPFDFTGTGAPAVWKNAWGFVPLVLVQHKPSGEDWGLNAYHSSIPTIAEMCLDASVCGQLLGQWLAPQWAVFGVGRTQRKVNRDGSVWLFEERGDAKALTANVDFSGAYEHIGAMMKWTADRQPELTLSRVREANLATGAAIRAMLFDLVRKLEMAQDQYDNGLVRVLQMCLTLGANADGRGTALEGFAGLGRFEEGAFNFGFDRPEVLAASKLEQAQAEAEMAAAKRQTELGNNPAPTANPANDTNALLASQLLAQQGGGVVV